MHLSEDGAARDLAEQGGNIARRAAICPKLFQAFDAGFIGHAPGWMKPR